MTRHYPRWIHHPNGNSVIVNDPGHEEAHGEGWYDTPADFPVAEADPILPDPTELPKVKGKPGPKPKVKE